MGTYTAGAVAARTGDEMSGPALLLAGLTATGSAASASALLAGITISAAVGGPLLGALLDRSPAPGRLLAWALLGYAAALVLVLLSLGRLPVAYAVAVAVCAGLLGPALSGGWTAQLPRVVTEAALPRANAADAMTFNLASLAGPALAGAVAGLWGAPAGVAVSALMICLALPCAWTLPKNPDRPGPRAHHTADRTSGLTAHRTSGLTTGLAADLAAGFRAIVRTRRLARATAASVLSHAGVGALIACVPLLAERALGAAGHGALLLTLVAAAGLTANAVFSRRPHGLGPDGVIRWSSVVLALAFLLAATAHPVLLVLAVVLAGAADGPALTALFAIRHQEAPGRLRGQIFTTGASLKITGFAVGAGLAGPLAARSLPAALSAAAVLELLAALVCTGAAPAGPRSGRPLRPARSFWFGKH
ncbi:MFS transporter [Streptomyces sp. MST-110588]|nr:MFS transporter [Streptomyces sp. MST-110588]